MSDGDNLFDLARQIGELKQRLAVIETGPMPKGLTLIETQTAGAGGLATFDFTGIPATFAKLVIDLYARGDTAAVNVGLNLTINNDGGANYDYFFTNAPISATWTSGEGVAATSIRAVYIAAANAPAGTFDLANIEIPQYANASGQKVMSSEYTHKDNTTTGNLYRGVAAGWWRAKTAISRVTLTPSAGNFAQYSTARLYGVY